MKIRCAMVCVVSILTISASTTPAQTTQESAEQTIAKWLAVFDAESRNGFQFDRPVVDADPLMSTLPSPSAWPALVKAIDARPLPENDPRLRRREIALRFLGRTLINDGQWLREHAAELGQLNSTNILGRSNLNQIVPANDAAPRDPGEAFEQLLASRRSGTLAVPNLITQVGEKRAEELLRKALSQPVSLSIASARTKALAQKLALEMMNELKVPQWMLTTPESLDLSEAMFARFTGPSAPAYDNKLYESQLWEAYLIRGWGLLQAGRLEDCIREGKAFRGPTFPITSLSSTTKDILERMQQSPKIYESLHKLLSDHPEASFWHMFRYTAIHNGRIPEMVALARKSMDAPGLAPVLQRSLRVNIGEALLASDKVDEGITYLREVQADPEYGVDASFSLAIQLSGLGTLLNKPEITREQIDYGWKIYSSQLDKMDQSIRRKRFDYLISEMIAGGMEEQAQVKLGDEISRVNTPDPDPFRTRQLLTATALIYHNARQHQSVLDLLTLSQGWYARDLSQLLTLRYEGSRTPLGVMAAAALIDAGRKDEARKVLEAMVRELPGLDATYALLVKMDGAAALPLLEALFARDRFEERPLIWKAVILKDQGKLEEAEQTARAAIAVDPSDGEQPRGDRMRVYAVLADILEAKGNAEQAAFFRGVVRAIRISEDADRLHIRYLHQRAVDLYTEALKFFTDAYCVQSRLALRLAELGFDELAEKHLQKAFELMPDSFGRVESHCFGCEGAFKTAQAQRVAEGVFTRLAATNPNKPQIHYLLGFLRQSQGRYREAIEAFRTAVKLDPDYLNAWKHLVECGRQVDLPQTDRDAAALAMIRLDPQGRHSSAAFSQIRDLEGLWNVAIQIGMLPRIETAPLMRLAGSVGQRELANPNIPIMGDMQEVIIPTRYPMESPAQAVSSTATVAALRQIMLQN